MLNLNDQFKQINASQFHTIFKKGIRDKRLCRKGEAAKFRLLPAFDPNNPDPATSVLPSIMPDGTLSNWGVFYYTSPFLGHGRSRKEIVSPKTLSPDAPCPLDELDLFIQSDKSVWGYLLDRDQCGGLASFSRPSPQMAINCIDLDKTSLGVLVGSLSIGAANSLVGLVKAKNTNPQILEMARTNYLIGYANGDITSPTSGVCLTCSQEEVKKGSYTSYKVDIMLDDNNMPVSRGVDGSWLRGRHRITEPNSFLTIMSYDDIVKMLGTLYTGRNPQGIHESEMLSAAFPGYSHLFKTPGTTVVVADPVQPVQPTASTPPGYIPPAPEKAQAGPKTVANNAPYTPPVIVNEEPAVSPEIKNLQETAGVVPQGGGSGHVHVPGMPVDVPPATATPGVGSTLSRLQQYATGG